MGSMSMLSTQAYSNKAGVLVGSFTAPSSLASCSASSGIISVRCRWGGRKMRLRPHWPIRAQQVKESSATTGEAAASSAIRAVVTVKIGLLSDLTLTRGLDDMADMLGKTLVLELISSQLQPNGAEKAAVKAHAHKSSQDGNTATYEAEFAIPAEFGEIGAVLVQNEHHKEMHLTTIILSGLPYGDLHITCDSWVASKFDDPQFRIFFTNKSYLPSETPDGLKKHRAKELELVRGNGQGERKSFDRIYDYAPYNDLGDPDANIALKRPVLGDKAHPYPRRCRTGRPPCKTDPSSETRSSTVYVPRDEQFSSVKDLTFSATTLYNVLHAVLPSLETAIIDPDLGFPHFSAIEALFDEGIKLPGIDKRLSLKDIIPRLIKAVEDTEEGILLFEPPALLNRDRFGWISDEEMARQTLAGLNPCSIKLVTEWPLKSKLDPNIYGPPESAITAELVEKQIKGFNSLSKAIEQKKLFIIDYHDAFLPYVNKVRKLKNTVLYGSRTLFYLLPNDTLRPIAIELTRPPYDGKPQWNEVYTPIGDSTTSWLWRFAKAHFLAHDAGYHQLISHWLRTHCCVEPYIIASNRQLSAMHPIYRLLHPHFRYTMEINALAREALINAGGIIESSFTPGTYSIEVSSAIYGEQWQFDLQALPADLISRGMAVADPSAPHGVKLTIQDYPFANDGLLIWDSIKEWVTDYVNHYYTSSEAVKSDEELQSWWTEIKTKGHGDKKDEPWWPKLETIEDLIGILNNIIWVASGHHAAVNFGQYAYGGYFPNRPTIARTKMPTEDPSDEEWNAFIDKPEACLLKCFPSQIQATKVMAILDVLSSHSPDEEYLGGNPEPSWAANAVLNAAFEKFSGRLKEIDGIVDGKNADSKLRNRCGAGVVPYELLKPFSKPGATGMGVPNSISI